MALQVWLPLTSEIKNQGLSNLTFTNTNPSVIKLNSAGKIGSCFERTDSSGAYLYSNETVHLGTNLSMFCWINFTSLQSSARTGICGTHRYSTNTGMGITIKYVSSTTGYISCNTGTGSSKTSNTYYGSTLLSAGTWYHVGFTYDGSNIKLYVNGQLDKTQPFTGMSVPDDHFLIYNWAFNATSGIAVISYTSPYKLNDVRAYDHCLSPREVAELAKGLVLHYPLSENITVMNNAYSYPTFDTNNAGGGWNHWGGSGHKGTYGQSTDKNYIFRPNQTYCHWVANGAGATYNYLLYQSPDYAGGYRSVQCICKEENGIEITNDVVYATWNNRSGGVPNNSWTSITPLGNGFYWCKAEGVMQDGNNDLIGFNVKPGYKVYFSEAYLENGKEICSDPFLTDRTTIYDTSGFGNNGEAYSADSTGYFQCVSGSPRYSMATNVHSGTSTTSQKAGTAYIRGDVTLTTPSQLTIAFWVYIRNEGYGGGNQQGLFCTSNATGDSLGSDYQNSAMNHRDSAVDVNNAAGNSHLRLTSVTSGVNAWHHHAYTYDGQYARSYLDGVLQGTVNFSSAQNLATFSSVVLGFSKAGGVWRKNNNDYSDLRVYATALTADQVKQLYEAPISLANNGTLFANEFNET